MSKLTGKQWYEALTDYMRDNPAFPYLIDGEPHAVVQSCLDAAKAVAGMEGSK